MCFFKKQSHELSQESHEQQVKNIKKCESLLAYASEDEETKKVINEVIQLLKYKVGPSISSEAKKIDSKIENKIDDVKVILSKKKEDTFTKAQAELNIIKNLIAERQVYSK